MFETVTLIRTGKAAWMPILLVGRPSWRSVVDFDELGALGVVDARDVDIFRHVETAEARPILEAHGPPTPRPVRLNRKRVDPHPLRRTSSSTEGSPTVPASA